MSEPRYALYYCPPEDSDLYRFGCRWLGRDAVSGALREQPAVAGVTPARLANVTSDARHYGFHGTLKPPFRLHPKAAEAQLVSSVGRFAAQLRPFIAPPLVLKELSGFLALQCATPSPEIDTLAAAAVTALDRFRAPATESELAKRRAAGLSDRQEEMLVRWGYPYVMDQFRFHLTLTCRLPDEAERAAFRQALEPMVARFAAEPLRVEAVALFRQDSRETPFLLTRYFPLSKI